MEQKIPAAEERLSEALAAFDFGAPVVGAVRYGESTPSRRTGPAAGLSSSA